MATFKFNRYIEIIPVPEDNCFLVFNIQSSSLEVIDMKEGFVLSEISALNKFHFEDYDKDIVSEFLENGFVVPADFSEVEDAENNYRDKNTGSTILITITTTTICNMDCPYCFEVHKPSVVLKDNALFLNIKNYVSSMILQSPGKYDSLSITWYGGEPLINIKAIQELTPILLEISMDYNLSYSAGIITNGIYLSNENTSILTEECFIDMFQVTIDGPAHIHNKNRPLKGKNQQNYSKILSNLASLPESARLTLRLNMDKEVASGIDELFDDLEKFKIWPQRFNSVMLDPRPIIAYDGANINSNDEKYFDHRDYFDFRQIFRRKKVKRYNDFQTKVGGKISKISWELPKKQPDCGTWGEEGGLVIDPWGNIHKCWETVHLPAESVIKANELGSGFSVTPFDYYNNYNRYQVKTACRQCKYISVCDQIACQKQSLINLKPACTIWKFKTKEFIKEQYLTYINTPELIGEPS
jgi:uncharacterized protein